MNFSTRSSSAMRSLAIRASRAACFSGLTKGGTVLDAGLVSRRRSGDLRGKVRLGLREWRDEPREGADQVGGDRDFTIAGVLAAADANGGHRELRGEPL